MGKIVLCGMTINTHLEKYGSHEIYDSKLSRQAKVKKIIEERR